MQFSRPCCYSPYIKPKFHSVGACPASHPSFLGAFYPGVKAAGAWNLLYDAEVKNAWSYISIGKKSLLHST
jgi:hypothetical protein